MIYGTDKTTNITVGTEKTTNVTVGTDKTTNVTVTINLQFLQKTRRFKRSIQSPWVPRSSCFKFDRNL